MIINSIAEWEHHCSKLKNAEDLDNAYSFLRKGERVYAGYHPFKEQKKMGLAISMITKRAAQLPVTKYSFGYRDNPKPVTDQVNAPVHADTFRSPVD